MPPGKKCSPWWTLTVHLTVQNYCSLSKGETKSDSSLLNLLRNSRDLVSPDELLFLYGSLWVFAQPFPTGYQAGAVAAQFPHHLA